MTVVLVLVFVFVPWIPASLANETDQLLEVDQSNPAALEEATRVLAEEVKLAAHPQTYLVVDLVSNAVIMKARGVELHRLPFPRWSAEAREAMTASYRLVARPPVARRKIDPSSPEQEPVSLTDMPTHYDLHFAPTFTLEVVPPADHAPLRWALMHVRAWGRWLRIDSFLSPHSSSPSPRLILTLPEDRAQSLAWSVVDGMPMVIRRPAR